MNISLLISELLKELNDGTTLPEIRYFSGTEKFSDASGNYESNSVNNSLIIFSEELKDKLFIKNKVDSSN